VTIPVNTRDYLLRCLDQVALKESLENREQAIALLNSLADDRKEGKATN
tara:strand:+ start:2203 stop:2349 length:147 start_codon:yes stop_codon:yes gene_type:complete